VFKKTTTSPACSFVAKKSKDKSLLPFPLNMHHRPLLRQIIAGNGCVHHAGMRRLLNENVSRAPPINLHCRPRQVGQMITFCLQFFSSIRNQQSHVTLFYLDAVENKQVATFQNICL
jgi:hypothetical protein